MGAHSCVTTLGKLPEWIFVGLGWQFAEVVSMDLRYDLCQNFDDASASLLEPTYQLMKDEIAQFIRNYVTLDSLCMCLLTKP